MRAFKTGLLIFTFIGFVSAQAALLEATMGREAACEIYLKSTLARYLRPVTGLCLVPGAMTYDQFPSGGLRERLESVYLTVSETTDIEGLSKILSLGDAREKTRIFDLLTHWAHTQPGVPVPLEEVSPKVVRCKTNSNGTDEANCWNASLVWHDFDYGLGHTPAAEILTTFRDPKRFRLLNVAEEIKYGDVIAVFNARGNVLNHTAIYLDDNLIWHKISAKNLDPYSFDTFQNLLMTWTQKAGEKFLLPELRFYRRVKN